MSDDALKYKIGVTLIKGIGPNLAKNLIAYLGNAENIFKEKKQHLAKIPGIGEVLSREIVSQEVLKRADEEVAFVLKNGIQPLFFTDKSYPFRLKECADAPVMIYYKGTKNLNETKFVGIVGTRKVTEYGKKICADVIGDFAAKIPNVTIVSGLAYGVDICCHKLAVEKRLCTIGALGHGIDRIYPATHRPTAVKMLENGGLITEYISKTNPDRQNFVQRNRIIAGLCDAVLVVESGIKGGALITAELANDYNRDVFAFPGRINDEYSAGCNRLIKENRAALIESADDVIRSMNWEPTENRTQDAFQANLFVEMTEEETEIVGELRKTPNGININELTITLNQPFSKVSSKLLAMEFKGLVKCLPGGIYKVIV